MSQDQITIRCSNNTTGRVKFLFPSIASNKQLMKNMGFIISDPQYDEKMEAFRNKKSFVANGQAQSHGQNGIAKEPIKESFVSPILEPLQEPKIEQPKNEVEPSQRDEKIDMAKTFIKAFNEATSIKAPKPKRVRRTKAQIEADKINQH